MLTLPIKRKWFDMIASGEKLEEYREIKPYYTARFGLLYRPLIIRLRAGYRADSPLLECKVVVHTWQGRPEWGAVPGVNYYVLRINSAERIQ